MRVTLILAVLLCAGTASAYPLFQFSSGNDRCSDCHYSPSGGGLLNVFGRSENAATISWTGDGRLLHGAWTPPDALAFGGDFRVAGVGTIRDHDDPQLAVFPMQADLLAHAETGPLSIGATVGLNGSARNRPDGGRLASYVVSREHYVMYQQAPGTPYVKAGRFFPALGIRMPDHTALERRALDMYTLQEPYALAGGASGDAWEAHASLFAPNPFAAGPRAFGGTAYYERYFGGASIAGQARVAHTTDDTRVLAGAIVKQWIPAARLLLLGELDAQVQQIPGASLSRLQLLGYGAANFVVLPGFAVGFVAQRWDPDLGLGGTARTTGELNFELFPMAHLELHVLARSAWSGSLTGSRDSVGLVQVHYWL